jgi:hypothetical protein
MILLRSVTPFGPAVDDMIAHPYETTSDSFYFVNDKLVMHNKAYYRYYTDDDEAGSPRGGLLAASLGCAACVFRVNWWCDVTLSQRKKKARCDVSHHNMGNPTPVTSPFT